MTGLEANVLRRLWVAVGVAALIAWLPVSVAATGLEPPTLYWWDYVFYSVALTAIVMYSAVLLTLRAFDWLYLSLTGAMILLLVASLDGVLATLLGAGPEFMGTAPLFIGAVTFAFLFAGIAWRIESPHKLARLKKPFYGFALLSLSLVPGYWVIDSMVPLYATLNTLGMLVVISTVFAPLSWDHLSRALHRTAILLPATLAVLVIGVYGAHFVGEGFSRPVLDWLNRGFILIYIGYSLGFGLIYVLEEIAARREAQQQADRAAREAAENALALQQAKQAFETARQAAARGSQQLAEASHDIRQPLGALRLALADLQKEQPGKDTQAIMQAVGYLEDLAHSYIQTAPPAADGEIARDEQARERVECGLVLNTVYQIHSVQAEAQGVSLVVQDDGSTAMLRPLAMVRTLSNLVANALDHARPEVVTVSCNAQSAGCEFAVIDDGIGMSAEQLQAWKSTGGKNPASPGFGIGLGVVQSQAEQNGWSLSIESAPAAGTRATIFVPQ